MEIRRVLERKDGTKMVIIPKYCDIKKGDYVKIIKFEENQDGRKTTSTKTN